MSKSKILIVDDNRHLRVTLTDHLKHEGYEPSEADSAESALALMASDEPDLIVLDINMPGMGGVGFLRRLMGEDGRTRIPIVILTARASMESFFDTVPVDGFLTKPCPMSDLRAKIEEVLSKRARQAIVKKTHGKVLIVEDDPTSAAGIVEAFEGAGFETAVLHSATDAIVHASSHAPRAILMKQFLPDMSGAAVAPILGAMPGTREIPIVLYDESRRHDDPRLFLSRIPDGVTRCVAGNQGEELLRVVRLVLPR